MEIAKTAESEVRSWLTELYPEKGELVSPASSPIVEDVPTSHDTVYAKHPVCTSASKIDDALRRKLRKKKQFDGVRHFKHTGSLLVHAASGQVNIAHPHVDTDDDCDSKVGAIKKPRKLTTSTLQNSKIADIKHLSKSAKKRLKKRLQKKTDT
ncbi:unnamed protein product [Ixodes pacificus]